MVPYVSMVYMVRLWVLLSVHAWLSFLKYTSTLHSNIYWSASSITIPYKSYPCITPTFYTCKKKAISLDLKRKFWGCTFGSVRFYSWLSYNTKAIPLFHTYVLHTCKKKAINSLNLKSKMWGCTLGYVRFYSWVSCNTI